MSHDTKPVVVRSQAKTTNGKPTAGQSSRAKQPSEMLQRWKVESGSDVPFTEKIFVKSQDKEQGSSSRR